MKIYVVNESKGSYDDFYTSPVRAFVSKEKAEQFAKELDKSHYIPDFISDKLSDNYKEWEEKWDEDNPYDYIATDSTYDQKWETDRNNYLKEQGLTDEQIKAFIQWEDNDQFEDWNESFIIEIELEE